MKEGAREPPAYRSSFRAQPPKRASLIRVEPELPFEKPERRLCRFKRLELSATVRKRPPPQNDKQLEKSKPVFWKPA